MHDEVLDCRTLEKVLLANSILVGMMNANEVILEQGRDLTHQDWHPHKKSEPGHMQKQQHGDEGIDWG